MASSDSKRVSILPDVVGLALLAAQLILIFRLLVPDDGFRLVGGVLAFVVLAGVALYMWRGEKPVYEISEPAEWAVAIGVSVFLGALSFGIDMGIGHRSYPEMSPFVAGTKVGSPFGFMLTLFICPGFTTVAVAGLIRSYLTQSENSE